MNAHTARTDNKKNRIENINSDIQTIDINREKKNTMLKLLEDQIISLNLNNLTPIEALNFLKEIKDKLEE